MGPESWDCASQPIVFGETRRSFYRHNTAHVPAQVAAQEIAQGPIQDRMAAIASHIAGQRRCASY